jgi:membrane-bound inhibitor of C-type lysozyme
MKHHRSMHNNVSQSKKSQDPFCTTPEQLFPTVLMPLNDIATEQTKATEKTQAATNKMLDYLANHPDATIQYHASDMILHIHSDASYLSVSNAGAVSGSVFPGEQIP